MRKRRRMLGGCWQVAYIDCGILLGPLANDHVHEIMAPSRMYQINFKAILIRIIEALVGKCINMTNA